MATLIAAAGNVGVDLEVLYTGALLHDLGLTPHLIAEAHIPSFQPVSVETLAFNDPSDHAA